MEIKLLRCFVAVADELHFGRAAQHLDMLPSALGRNIRLLEEELGVRLFLRTTRNVILTKSGQVLLQEARILIHNVEEALERVRESTKDEDRVFRLGAIDSAATGLIPQLVHDFRSETDNLEINLEEDKSVKLLPKLLSGALDVAFVRPPAQRKEGIKFEFLLNERTVVAMPKDSELAKYSELKIHQLAGLPMIAPSPRNRPHSYNLTNKLFIEAGLTPNYTQQAEEKHTIINLVAAEVGIAIIPYWTSRITVENVVFRPLVDQFSNNIAELPLAIAWVDGSKDELREQLVQLLKNNLKNYSK